MSTANRPATVVAARASANASARTDTGVEPVLARIADLFDACLRHDGHAGFRVEMRILKRRQKEIIVDCGRQYRFVLDFEPESGSRT